MTQSLTRRSLLAGLAAVPILSLTALSLTARAQLFPEDPIIAGVRNNDVVKIRQALLNGASANGTTADKIPLLVLAAQLGHREALAELINAGARLNDRAPDGQTALTVAARRGDLSCAQLLLLAKADVNKGGKFDETPLFQAIRSGNVPVVQALIEAGADLELSDPTGRTAVELAQELRLPRIEAVLRDAGAS